eukprot:298567-Rhodomonas_salina.2
MSASRKSCTRCKHVNCTCRGSGEKDGEICPSLLLTAATFPLTPPLDAVPLQHEDGDDTMGLGDSGITLPSAEVWPPRAYSSACLICVRGGLQPSSSPAAPRSSMRVRIPPRLRERDIYPMLMPDTVKRQQAGRIACTCRRGWEEVSCAERGESWR